MNNESWLLPEGIEELLPPEAKLLEAMRRQLLDLYSSWGYDLVIPPFIEYLESLLTGTGNDLELKTFKLLDQQTGRMMGIRADMTPQVARIDAHHLDRSAPSRLCYMGSVLHTLPETHGGSRSPLQIGAELYGHGGIESDIEILRLMVATLKHAGVGTIHLDIGHVAIFRALAAQAGLDAQSEALLFDALQRKAKPEIGALLASLALDAEVQRMLEALADLHGDSALLDEAAPLLAAGGEEVAAALAQLRAVNAAIAPLADVVLHFDLAELRGYHYHTGLVFAAFVPGGGQSIAQGGRYDGIGQVFGRARAATGFTTDLKSLLLFSAAADSTLSAIYAPAVKSATLLAAVERLRGEGERVIQALPGQEGGAREMGCDRTLVERDGQWLVE